MRLQRLYKRLDERLQHLKARMLGPSLLLR
jgi:hypothetical protein